jgi:hypothetical protein
MTPEPMKARREGDDCRIVLLCTAIVKVAVGSKGDAVAAAVTTVGPRSIAGWLCASLLVRGSVRDSRCFVCLFSFEEQYGSRRVLAAADREEENSI